MHKECHSSEWPSPSSVPAWLAMTVAGAPSNALSPKSPEGGGAEEEGGPKTTIGRGREGEWAPKWGHNDDNDEYDADDATSAARSVQQST